MTIMAKFDGKCNKCGEKIKAGTEIEWIKGKGAGHVICPEKTAQAQVVTDPNAIRLSQGQGYGGREFHSGQVIRHAKHGLITVVTASKRYIREDGMSFGVGDEEGYIYSATCRPATDEEAAPLIERERKSAELSAAKKRLNEIQQLIKTTGERPTEEQPEGEKLMNTQDIYGGGNWWELGNGIWYVQNNGADGDNWSSNNVRTGGAGAIGWRIPSDDVLSAEIRALAEILKK